MDQNNEEAWFDYGCFSLLVGNMSKAGECVKECLAINQQHLNGIQQRWSEGERERRDGERERERERERDGVRERECERYTERELDTREREETRERIRER